MPAKSLQPGESSGFIPVDPTLTDWKAGGETGVLELPRILGGDWRPFLTAGKWQRFFFTASNGIASSFESEACVSFSAVDDLEAFMNWMIANNNYSHDDVQWLKTNGYFDVDGKISLSPRFTAKMSGTTINGNSLPNAAASLRHDGAIPSANWDIPLAQFEALNPSSSTFQADAWAIYYADTGAANIALGQAFAARFDVQYEWIAYPGAPLTPAQFLSKLSVAPLQIATAVCPPWNTDQVLQACGAGTAHATLMTFYEAYKCFDIRDHYVPFDKKFSPDYVITYAMRIICVSKGVSATTYPAPLNFSHNFTMQMDLNISSPEVVALQNALKIDGEFPVTVQSTGFFGTVTQTAVQQFQTKHGIVSSGTPASTGYGRVGAKTLAVLNTLFYK